MDDIIIKIIAGFISTIGFAVIFRLKPAHWILAAIDGLVACVLYFLLTDIFGTVFIPNLVASLACAFVAEIFARLAKTPSTVFLLPGIISLVPGGVLYYSMNNLLNENYIEAGENLLTTVEIAVAIGGGIIGASILRIILFKVIDSIKLKFKKS